MKIEERLDIIESRLDDIEQHLAQLNNRISGLQIIGGAKWYDEDEVLNSLREL